MDRSNLTNHAIVSVLMPVKNGVKYIPAAVDSILSQTENRFELLIANDQSTDDTLRIVSKFTGLDGRVRVIHGDGRSLSRLRNLLVEESRCELIAWMDADDIAAPGRIQKQVEFMQSHPDCDIAGSAVEVIDQDGDSIRIEKYPSGHTEIVSGILAMTSKGLCLPASIMRRSAFNRVQGFRVPFASTAEDVDLFLRMSEFGRLANIPEVLLKYRWHPKSLSWTQSYACFESSLLAVQDFRLQQRLPPLVLPSVAVGRTFNQSQVHDSWAVTAADAGNYATAVKHAKHSLWLNPFQGRPWRTLSQSLFPLAEDRSFGRTRRILRSAARRVMLGCAAVGEWWLRCITRVREANRAKSMADGSR